MKIFIDTANVEEIPSLVDGLISAEVISLESAVLLKEAHKLAKIRKKIVIKIPIIPDGLKAVKILSSEGIKTNVTIIFSPLQALLAALAGVHIATIPTRLFVK